MITDDTPIPERCGTRLDHYFTRLIVGDRNGKRVKFGTLDSRQRVYQHGGDLSNLVFWKLRCVAFGPEEWAITSEIDWIEVLDYNTNKCYRTSIETAKRHAYSFNGGIGQRMGVPLDCFDVFDRDWNLLTAASLV